MVIENRKTAIGIQLRRLLLILLLTAVVVLLFYMDLFRDDFLGIPREVYVFALIGTYLVYYLWGSLRGYYYFYFNDLGAKLIFKYYSLAPLSKRQRTIEIEKSSFYKFQLEKRWMGLRQYLILYQQISGRIAKYPPISLGLLSKTKILNLEESLKLFQKVK